MNLQTPWRKKVSDLNAVGVIGRPGVVNFIGGGARHAISETPVIVPQQMELCVVIAGTHDGLVRRTGAGQCQEAVATSGAISLTPIGSETIRSPSPPDSGDDASVPAEHSVPSIER